MYIPIFSYYEYLINLNICEYFVFLNYLQQLHFSAIETILKLAYRNLFYELSTILHGINIRIWYRFILRRFFREIARVFLAKRRRAATGNPSANTNVRVLCAHPKAFGSPIGCK